MNNESSVDLPIGSYTFITVTYDGFSSKIYIDGIDCSEVDRHYQIQEELLFQIQDLW